MARICCAASFPPMPPGMVRSTMTAEKGVPDSPTALSMVPLTFDPRSTSETVSFTRCWSEITFFTDRFFDLGEVLACNRDPFLPVFDQTVPASGKAGKIVDEIRGQPIVAGRIHPQVVVKQ